jgi:hypothetical protein
MDGIEPIRPSPPAIAPIDSTRVKVLRGDRDRSQQGERDVAHGGSGRESESGSDARRERPPSLASPSVVIDAELLGEHDALLTDGLPDPAPAAAGQSDADGPPHIDLTV